MQFISVTASQSNSQGHVGQMAGGRPSFKVNIDLVAAINGREVFLKTPILQLGGNYFVNFQLADNVKPESL